MNSTTEPSLPALQPPQPPQQHRLSTSCDRHPEENFTGFCPACLCERLASLDPNNNNTSSKPVKPPTSSTAVSALKAIFKPSNSKPSSSDQLRRTKSFSASKNEGFSGAFEPQRKSCDVRNTLSSLFNSSQEQNSSESKKEVASSSSIQVPVVQREVEEEENNSSNKEDYIEVFDEPANVPARASVSEEIVEEVEEEEEVVEPEEEEEVKTMKDHIDLDTQTKKPSSKGGLWSAASVFSKKLQKWRQKQKMKKRRDGGGSARLPVEKPIGRQLRDTQSEIADYGYGRRSCDTDPRFSLDAGRMSFDVARMSFDAARMSLDDPRYSFDEPRASWDGYLIGRTMPPRLPTRLSVVEDAPVHVLRTDMQIPVEEPPMNSINEDEMVPGGTAQTRDYYLDSSTRRRKSLDRSSSIRKTAAAVVAEIEEMKAASSANSKVSVGVNGSSTHGSKLVPEKDTNSNYSSSLRDDGSEHFDTGFRDNVSVIGNCEGKGAKKPSKWSKALSMWGLINRKGGNKDEDDDDRFSRVNGVERSLSESWQGLRGERNGDTRGAFEPKMFRSNSSVGWRNSSNFSGSFGSMRSNGVDANGHDRKKKDDFVLERNRSARYSPNNVDNGLLRFYLAPASNGQRNGLAKSRSGHAHSIARRVLRMY